MQSSLWSGCALIEGMRSRSNSRPREVSSEASAWRNTSATTPEEWAGIRYLLLLSLLIRYRRTRDGRRWIKVARQRTRVDWEDRPANWGVTQRQQQASVGAAPDRSPRLPLLLVNFGSFAF
jgi:hypothetical protein